LEAGLGDLGESRLPIEFARVTALLATHWLRTLLINAYAGIEFVWVVVVLAH